MANEAQIQKFREMPGHKFEYDGQVVTVNEAYVDGEEAVVELEGYDPVRYPIAHLGKLLDAFTPTRKRAGEVLSLEDSPALPSIRLATNTETLCTVRNALLDNITRVQADPAYIPQAKAVAEAGKQIVELAKTEIEMLKLMRDVQRG